MRAQAVPFEFIRKTDFWIFPIISHCAKTIANKGANQNHFN